MNVQVLSDQVLLNNYLSGDRNAISRLIERHSRRVRDYINMMVKDRDVAEDIFQETFIKAVRVIDEGRYTDNGKFLSWILRIAHNQVIDHFRAQRQREPEKRDMRRKARRKKGMPDKVSSASKNHPCRRLLRQG